MTNEQQPFHFGYVIYVLFAKMGVALKGVNNILKQRKSYNKQIQTSKGKIKTCHYPAV